MGKRKSTSSASNGQLTLWQAHGNPFEAIKHIDEQGEYWLARELMLSLEYTEWRNFTSAIARAKTACTQAGYDTADHFVASNKMVDVGSKTKRKVTDVRLSRLACYFTANNGDPSKPIVALAQNYFIVETRKQELGIQRKALPPARQTKEYRALLDSGYTDEQAIQRMKSRERSKENFHYVSRIWHKRGGDIGRLADRSTLQATGKHVWEWKEQWHVKESPRNYFSTAMLNMLAFVEQVAADLSETRGATGTEELARDIDRATSYVDFEALRRDYPTMFLLRPPQKPDQLELTDGAP